MPRRGTGTTTSRASGADRLLTVRRWLASAARVAPTRAAATRSCGKWSRPVLGVLGPYRRGRVQRPPAIDGKRYAETEVCSSLPSSTTATCAVVHAHPLRGCRARPASGRSPCACARGGGCGGCGRPAQRNGRRRSTPRHGPTCRPARAALARSHHHRRWCQCPARTARAATASMAARWRQFRRRGCAALSAGSRSSRWFVKPRSSVPAWRVARHAPRREAGRGARCNDRAHAGDAP